MAPTRSFCAVVSSAMHRRQMSSSSQWHSAAYLLPPIDVYFFGSFLSEWMGKTIKRMHFLRWDTLLIALEMCAVVFLAFIPAVWPDQICQVTLNFVCAMQFNTYRQMEGVLAATTFVTNHIRQTGSNLAKLARHPEDHGLRRKVKAHTSLLLCFMAGAVVSTMLCEACSYSSLLGALIPLGCTFVRLVHADLVLERGQLDVVPHGH